MNTALKNAESMIEAGTMEKEKLFKRNEEDKVFFEYELENLKKKLIELELENDDLRSKFRQGSIELEVTIRESELKTESIVNLEKIVNELLRKNSLLADNTVGTIEESLKKDAELEFKTIYVELENQARRMQEERVQIESDYLTLENRFGEVVKDNERYKYDNGNLKEEVMAKDSSLNKAIIEAEELRFALKKEQSEKARVLGQFEESAISQKSLIEELKADNDRLGHQERALKQRVKDL